MGREKLETTEMKTKVKQILCGMFDMNPEVIPDTKPFQEIAKYDSMRALEFLAKLEGEFNFTMDPDLLYQMSSVDSAVDVVRGLLLKERDTDKL